MYAPQLHPMTRAAQADRCAIATPLLRCAALAAILSALAAAPAARAALQINWSTIDCGGALTLSGGTIELSGTLGQHDAGAVLAGGTIELTGGFWAGLAQTPPLTCGCGDLDGNNVVDLGDFATFAGCFGLAAPDGNCTAEVFACADLNGSGAIDLNDFSLFSGAFGLPPAGSPPDCQ